jgi:RNA polymerase sigma-70 factor (ECF subfamily)
MELYSFSRDILLEEHNVLILASRGEARPKRMPPGSEVRPASSAPTADPDWNAIVTRIREGDSSAQAKLYEVFARGMRFVIHRQLGLEGLEDNLHECYLVTLEAIQKGQLREPERLMGFVRTVVQRQVCLQIGKRAEARRRILRMDARDMEQIHQGEAGPERAMAERQRIELMRQEVEKLPPRDREVLTRFYLRQQTKEEICLEMDLTSTQFRLAKSRSKAKLTASARGLREAPVRRLVNLQRLAG